ncbi:DNA mismatch repair protein [Spiromyces aspiralis]|uniref:DNA mismatch repair protein n=1 Tax=Spiromyces aspiralis TaxID=68401 RepID=A0ACC1HVD6_9FUNG|nr:DNA mismatch repair protein [Spiromyces aspiralis]
MIYGTKVASAVKKFQVNSPQLKFECTGLASDSSHSMRKSVLLIFINHRLVDCPPLKRAVENLYGTVLPKSSKPFLYIDLRLDPLVVDVNVHPTKREVQFLNQDEILFLIVDKVRDILTQTNQSRNYHVQSLLSPTKTAALDAGPIASGESSPRTPLPTGDKQRGNGADDGNKSNNDSVEIQLSLPNTPKRRNGAHMPVSIVTPPSSNTPRSARKIPEQIMVRTDSRSLPLQSFAFTSPTAKSRLSYQLLSDNDSDEDLALEFTKSTSSRPSSTSKGGANATLLTRQIPVTMVPLTETTQPQADPATASSPSILKRKYDESAATAVTTSTSPTRQPLQTTLFGTQAAQPGSKPPHVAPKNAPQPSSGSGSSQGQAETHQQGGGSPLVPPHADTPLTLASSLNIKKRPRVNVRLTSILELQQELKDTQHRELTQVLNGHHFVGFIDCTRVLVQHQTKLYVVDLQDISEELFYQLVIKDFHNFGYMVLDPPAPIYDLVLAALRVEEAENNLDERLRPVETVARAITDLIVSRQEMLDEYYCMKITSSGLLQTLPMLLRNYHPSMTKLPLFLLRIGCEVNWENEREFFEGFSRELAYLYACEPPESPPTPEGSSIQPEQESSSQDTGEADNAEMAEYKSMVQHTLLSALKTGFVATSRLTESRCVMQIADLPDLYKIFERC